MPPTTPRKSTGGAEEERMMLRHLAKTDLFVLVNTILNANNPSNLVSDELHRVGICEFIKTTPYRENLYLISRGHRKTGFITVGKNIQRILNDPSCRILIGSNKAENAEGFLDEIKSHLENPFLIWLFPEILVPDPAKRAPEWSKGSITVKRKKKSGSKESTIETIGLSGEITSRHYEHGTLDDLVGKENYATRDLRESVKKFIKDARPLFEPSVSTLDYVGTSWHYDDAYAWLMEQKKAGLRQLGVFLRACWTPDPDGEDAGPYGRVRLAYPEKFTVQELLEIRGQGIAEFAAQYLINPLPADTVYFPREAIAEHIVPRTQFPPLADLWIVITLDPAISEKHYADYSAVTCVGFDRTGAMWVLDIRRGRWPESETVAQVYDVYARIKAKGGHVIAIGVEAIGFAKLYRTQFTIEGEKRGYYLNILKLERESNRTKGTRIRALEPFWSAGEIRLDSGLPMLEEFLSEAERFRPDRENAHDDMLDALVDTLQLRARPEVESRTSLYEDDPEWQARTDFERDLHDTRAKALAPPLDRTELRAAWNMKRRREADEAVMASASAVGEFF